MKLTQQHFNAVAAALQCTQDNCYKTLSECGDTLQSILDQYVDEACEEFEANSATAEYTIVQWPESQELMGDPIFSSCILINTETGQQKYGSSAYLVPKAAQHIYNRFKV